MLTGVVHPCSADGHRPGAVEAAAAGLILPVLFGPEVELLTDRGSGASGHRQVPDRGHGRRRGLGAQGRRRRG